MSDAATAVIERPIPFAGAMVRALLNGTKVQTRRVVKPQDAVDATDDDEVIHLHGHRCGGFCDFACSELPCPYGVIGDRLWVREAWRARVAHNAELPSDVASNGRSIMFEADYIEIGAIWGKYRHARFMPRALSRIVLEVTDVRVQRVQDISEDDALAEGVEMNTYFPERWSPEDGWLNYDYPPDYEGEDYECCVTARDSFASLWRSINGAGSWDASPWVWALTFKRVTP